MSNQNDVGSNFDPLHPFVPIHNSLEIKYLDFENRDAYCQLNVEGTFSKTIQNYVRFHSILPSITEIYVSTVDSGIYNCQFIYLNEDTDIDLNFDNGQVISQKTLLQNVVDREDSMGGGNIQINLPSSFVNFLTPRMAINITFEFSFRFDRPKNEDFDLYFIDYFITPFDVMFPSAGYKSCLWFPCLNSTLLLTGWDIRITVPINLTVVSTGTFKSVSSTEKDKATWVFSIDIPTRAGDISIVAGQFNFVERDFLIGYSITGYIPCIQPALELIKNFFEFMTDTFNFNNPYKTINIIFVSRTKKCGISGNLFIFSSHILCQKTNIIQLLKNYYLFGQAISDYIFGSIVSPRTIADLWIIAGLSRFLYYLFCFEYFGECEFLYLLNIEQKRACEIPNSSNKSLFNLTPHVFIVDLAHDSSQRMSSASALRKWYTSSHPRLLFSKSTWKTYIARCGLTLRWIEKAITTSLLKQVMSRILSMYSETSSTSYLSTELFFSLILNITGKDILMQTCRNWLAIDRPLHLTIDYSYNRRRSSIDVSVYNEEFETETNIPVTLSLTVQEFEGAFQRPLQLDRGARRSTFEISVHALKSRRANVKKRVLTENGREVDIEIVNSSASFKPLENVINIDNPVLWIRVNPELCTFYGHVRINQPESSWYYQASLESRAECHLKAVKKIIKFPCNETVTLLAKLIKNSSTWFRIRIAAFESLVALYNQLPSDEMVKIDKEFNPNELYRSVFCLKNFPELPRINDFSDIPLFLFQISAIRSLASLKMVILKDIQKPRVFLGYELLRTLFEYNDNASNYFEDCCYRAVLLDAIGDSLNQLKNDLLNDASIFVLTESLNSLKLDELGTYFHGCVANAALNNILKLQKMKFINFDSNTLVHCSSPGIEERLRHSVVFLLAEYVQITQSMDEYFFLLNLISQDHSFLLRLSVVQALIKFPPFNCNVQSSLSSHINNEEARHNLHSLIEKVLLEEDSFSLFQNLSEYYNILYGEGYKISKSPDEYEALDDISFIPEVNSEGMLKLIIKPVESS